MSIADLLVRLGRGLYALLLFVEKILICVYSEICLALGAKNICPVHRFVKKILICVCIRRFCSAPTAENYYISIVVERNILILHMCLTFLGFSGPPLKPAKDGLRKNHTPVTA